MYGASYIRLVGYVHDGGILCRACAERRGENVQGEDWTPLFGYDVDSADEPYECDECGQDLSDE